MMKRISVFIVFVFIAVFTAFAQQRVIEGQVLDEHSKPMENANVFIKGTTDGTGSDADGRFRLITGQKGDIVICVMMLGYSEFTVTVKEGEKTPLIIKMKPDNVSLDDVVVVAGNFKLKGNSQWGGMSAVDIATTGGSSGDLYRSLQTLPGTQVVGETGRLYVRGGESTESQTYIDEMHVLSPYTTTGANEPVRGRYSPFMFEGVNFSTGGYSSEYAQGLSSVLPLSTKDVSPISKIGINPSVVGLGGGGTQSFSKGSVSLSLNYEDLAPYESLFPDRMDWIKPYKMFSGGTQMRFNPDDNTVFKTYVGYDRTSFAYHTNPLLENSLRSLGLNEDNLYINSTFRKDTHSGYKFFAGGAFSFKKQNVDNALSQGDFFGEKEWEMHLKSKVTKRFTDFLKLNLGAESLIRHYQMCYDDSLAQRHSISHSINGLFAVVTLNLTGNLSAELSSRAEYTTLNSSWKCAPRLALTYNLNGFHLSGIAGRYNQLPENTYLIRNKGLSSEECTHYIAGLYHEKKDKIYRVEAYYKKYDNLVLKNGEVYNSDGYGYSKGIDLFFNDRSLFRNLEYMLAYSYNLSKRKYLDFATLTTPQFGTKHNATISLKYNIPSLKTIWGITNRFASGRPYHDPEKEGLMNATTKSFNSLDLSLTYLASKRVIVYASASNLLGRKNVFNYSYSKPSGEGSSYQATPVTSSSDHFFYVGIFITLSGKAAYDVSNF
jgi:hypothetical protein